MRTHILATILIGNLAVAGCARWEPSHRPGPVTFDRACPLRRAPRVEEFGEAGVRAVYHFVTGRASEPALGAFLRHAEAEGFNVMPLTVQMDGIDTRFVHGRGVLRDQRAVDREFSLACGLGGGRIYLTHVRHNPAGQAGDIRLR